MKPHDEMLMKWWWDDECLWMKECMHTEGVNWSVSIQGDLSERTNWKINYRTKEWRLALTYQIIKDWEGQNGDLKPAR